MAGRPRKAPILDEKALEELRREVAFYQQLEADRDSQQGKRLLEILDNTREETIQEFIKKDLEKIEANKIIFFLASVRSKLQTIESLKSKYLDAKNTKDELLEEFNRCFEQVKA